MSKNIFTQDLIKKLRSGERVLNGRKINDLYRNCPAPELKNFLRGYARSLNGVADVKNAEWSNWNYREPEPTAKSLADTTEPHKGYDYSGMANRFHPAQGIYDVLGVRKREARLNQVWTKLHLAGLVGSWRRPKTSMNLLNMLIILGNVFNAPIDQAVVPARKNGSCKAAKWEVNFLLSKDDSELNDTQKAVFNAFSNRKDRKNAWRLYCELVGSCFPSDTSQHSLLDTGVKHEAAVYDKYGILLEVLKDPTLNTAFYTMIFVTMMTTELGKRNSFTLDPQRHGSLNVWLKYYLDNFGDKIERYDVVFAVLPCDKYYKLMNEGHKKWQLAIWSQAVYPIAWYLNRQFDLGVAECIGKDMLVPRRGTTNVDSGGYNSVTGAWNNALRHLRWLHPGTYDVCYKCMKLLAGDQMQWAAYETAAGGANADHLDENTKQMNVFKELTKLGYRPWSTLFDPNRINEIQAAIMKSCESNNVPSGKWLGRSKLRTDGKTEAQTDQVCGISVPQGSGWWFSSWGFFGATKSTMK